MKWTPEQTAELKDLCMKEASNTELAVHFNVPVTEIHAKRSQLGITIPKVRAAKAAIVNPEFEAVIQIADEQLPLRCRHGLNSEIREHFHVLQDAILLAMARNGTSLAKARIYSCLGQTVAAIEDAYDGMLRDEE